MFWDIQLCLFSAGNGINKMNNTINLILFLNFLVLFVLVTQRMTFVGWLLVTHISYISQIYRSKKNLLKKRWTLLADTRALQH